MTRDIRKGCTQLVLLLHELLLLLKQLLQILLCKSITAALQILNPRLLLIFFQLVSMELFFFCRKIDLLKLLHFRFLNATLCKRYPYSLCLCLLLGRLLYFLFRMFQVTLLLHQLKLQLPQAFLKHTGLLLCFFKLLI